MSEKRIAFFQYDMKVGGIQHSLYALLSRIKEDKDICADVFINHPADVFYDMGKLEDNENIRIFFTRPLPYANRFMKFEKVMEVYGDQVLGDLCEALGGALPEYDLAIDFNSYQNDCAIGALSVSAISRVCWIHNDVIKKHANEKKYAVLRHFFKGKYIGYDAFAAVSEGVIIPFHKLNPNASENDFLVKNLLDEQLFKEAVELPSPFTDPSRRNVVWVGRFNHQKGTDILMDLMNRALADHEGKDLFFTLIGRGPDDEKLRRFILKNKLTDRISLKGNLKDPLPYIRHADVYLSTSRYEGQGISVMEAHALGTPVIMPSSLEAYAQEVKGCDDLLGALLAAPKKSQVSDPGEILEAVKAYNDRAYGQFLELTDKCMNL